MLDEMDLRLVAKQVPSQCSKRHVGEPVVENRPSKSQLERLLKSTRRIEDGCNLIGERAPIGRVVQARVANRVTDASGIDQVSRKNCTLRMGTHRGEALVAQEDDIACGSGWSFAASRNCIVEERDHLLSRPEAPHRRPDQPTKVLHRQRELSYAIGAKPGQLTEFPSQTTARIVGQLQAAPIVHQLNPLNGEFEVIRVYDLTVDEPVTQCRHSDLAFII